jgi:hypothetical protein
MTPDQLIDDLVPCGLTRDFAVRVLPMILNYLADNAFYAETAEGLPVRDVSDFAAWLRQLAVAARAKGRAA